jgi:hypothetical protein
VGFQLKRLITCSLILGFRFVSPISISSVFHGFIGLGMGRKNMLRWLLIWHSTIWAIWNSQNEVIFARRTVYVESLVDKVKLSSWKWYNLVTPAPSLSGRTIRMMSSLREELFLSNLWRIRWNFNRGSDIWLKTPVTPAPSMSGRCNPSCVGADSSRWTAGCGFCCILVVFNLFFAGLLFFLFFIQFVRCLGSGVCSLVFCSFGQCISCTLPYFLLCWCFSYLYCYFSLYIYIYIYLSLPLKKVKWIIW